MQRAWVLVFVMACASSPPAAPPMAPTSTAGAGADTSCDQAVGKMMDTLTAGKADAPPAEVKKYHDLFVSHCQADAWSPQVRACFAGIKSLDEGDKCASQMTDAQRQALDQATQPDGQPPAAAPAAKPAATAPPTPPPSSSTRSPTTKPTGKSGDPCDGGN